MSDYQQTIDYLFTRLPMFSRIGAPAYKADLTNTIRLCEALGNPHKQFKSIHIAGTNGKGSTSHMLAAILQTAGYKTGLYTSPHLKDFRERIKINGEWISEAFVIDFTENIKHLIEQIQPSFFEITVAMAFSWFALQKVDVAVIETGLGGRLDSTNIVTPELSVITNIGYDHMNILGDTLDKIAYEKAGIIKENVPVVIGESTNETLPVFQQQSAEVSSPILLGHDKYWIADWQWEKEHLHVTIADKHNDERLVYQLDLSGIYQTKNLLTVLSSTDVLKKQGWNITSTHIKDALKHVRKLTGLHGRWEMIYREPMVFLDVAHNEDGIRQLVEQLEHYDDKQLHIIIGMVKDKDINKVLRLLPAYARYYFTQAQIPRALPAAELQQQAKTFSLSGDVYSDVNSALQQALNVCHKEDLILVCGSVFLVGEVNPL